MARFACELGTSLRAALCLLACGTALGCGDSDSGSEAVDGAPGGNADAAGPTSDADTQARFHIRWNLEGGCDRGDTIETTVSSLSDGRTFVDDFQCVAGEGLSAALPPGEFNVVVRLLDNDDVVTPPDAGLVPDELVAISDVSGPHTSVPGSDVAVDVAFSTTAASITASWNFSEDSDPQSCAEAGVANVEVVYERDGQPERTERIACSAGMDLSGLLPTGLYTVSATPLDAGGTPQFPASTTEVGLFVGNQVQSTTFRFASVPL